MSKLSKLIYKPKLFFKDALKKHIIITNKVAKANFIQEISKSVPLEKTDEPSVEVIQESLSTVKLVIIDNLDIKNSSKSRLVKYQLRSIVEYTNFSDISYISKNILSNNPDISVYKSYEDFYASIKYDLNINKIIFINLEFFFFKSCNEGNFFDGYNKPLIFLNKKRRMDDYLKRSLSYYLKYFNFNVEFFNYRNISVCNSFILNGLENYRNELYGKELDEFIFDFLPMASWGLGLATPCLKDITYMNMIGDYYEKLHWLLSIRGSKGNAPIGLVCSYTNDNNIQGYLEFLDIYFPHHINEEANIELL